MKIESTSCTVTGTVLRNLIEAVVHTLSSSESVALADDEHYRGLVTMQVESTLALADEAGIDLWFETTAPAGREMTQVAYLLREADAKYGLPSACPVPGCASVPVLCCPRPLHRRRARHGAARRSCARPTRASAWTFCENASLSNAPHSGPIHAACMPMPSVVALAPSPAELAGFDVS